MNRILAFVRRDFRIATSYKLQFVFRLLSGFFIIAVVFLDGLEHQEALAVGC
ncbi:MAG: hypothetical protein IH987_16335 [Planctomycetes bacterium]|nr:hypothetical protein [Planctomycetota bacterium]